jgi:hypothetical protein
MHHGARTCQPPPAAPVDYEAMAKAALALLASFDAEKRAERAGRPFSKVPRPPPESESEWSPAMRAAMRNGRSDAR